MPYSSRNGLSIWYAECGEGLPIVLIHANPFDHRLFLHQIARWSGSHRVIAPDLRGYGRSEKPETAFTLADITADVLGVCADCGVRQAIFVGVSVGSGVAMQIALARPDMVRALVLVGGSSRGPRRVDAIVREISEGDLAGALTRLMRRYVAPGFAETPYGAWMLGMFAENAGRLSAASIAQVFRARASCDMSGRLGELQGPVLVLNGAYDESLPAGRETASLIPGARHAVIAGAGHACCLDNPAGFDAAVVPFLRDCGLWAAGAESLWSP